MTIENYDVLVIGSGEAGKYLASTMAGEGHRTAVVERKLIGGQRSRARLGRGPLRRGKNGRR
jgi:pyruvate/2-oxoglutarate dehydrogenase complex dihydrolipoamide dehydrogenase (E3) component